MDTLLVECPIHLDAVPINDIRVFKCGHGFCEPCLAAHIARNATPLTCPTCRKPVKRKEAFQLFLTPARSSTQIPNSGSSPTRQRASDVIYHHLISELDELKAVHANCSTHHRNLQDEVDSLSYDITRHLQTIQVLSDRKQTLETRLAKEAEKVKDVTEENDKLKGELNTLWVQYQKSVTTSDKTRQDLRDAEERVKQFQGYIDEYKRTIALEKKKRKALERENHRPPKIVEDESLMVVDANAPDILRRDNPDLEWLDEACEVKGDMLDVTDGQSEESERESEDELRLGISDHKGKLRAWMDKGKGKVGSEKPYAPPGKEGRAVRPLARFSSDWILGPELMTGASSGRKRKPDSSRVGGSKFYKVKAVTGTHKTADPVLAIDRHGRVKGTVALGSRQKLNSKN